MPYKVLQDGATLKKLIKLSGSNREPNNKSVPIYETTVYFEGDIVEDEELAPIHIEQYDAEQGNIRDLIERVETKKKSAKQDKKVTRKATPKAEPKEEESSSDTE